MKTSLKTKIITILILSIVILNFCLPAVNAAIADQLNGVLESTHTEGNTVTKEDGITTGISSWLGGILYYPIHLMVGVVTAILELVAEGITGKDTVTVGDILFNDVEIVNIDFFNSGSSSSVVQSFKASVAKWYYVMRTIAIIASLCVLLYIAIRMAISTVADDKAKYKNMFKDWVVSFCILFVLHYIVILVIKGNNVIVDIMKNAYTTSTTTLKTYIAGIRDIRYTTGLDYTVAEKFGAGVALLMLAWYTLVFLWQYLKRLFIVGFLMMIAPLITITYAIDKVGDGKAQALNKWIKEFFWTVLIQPFQCVIYITIVSTGFEALAGSKSFTSAIFLLFCMNFLLKADGIIKEIFGIEAKNMGSLGDAAGDLAKFAVVSKMLKPSSANNRTTPKTPKGIAPKAGGAAAAMAGGAAASSAGTTGKDSGAAAEKASNVGTTGEGDSAGISGQVPPTSGDNDIDKSTQAQSANKTKFDTFMNKYLNPEMGKKAMSGIYKGYTATKPVISGYTKAMGAVIGGAFALTTPKADFLGKSLAGYAAGKKVAGSLENHIENSRTANKEESFDNAYDNYLQQNQGLDISQIESNIDTLSKIDLGSEEATKLTEAEKKLAETIQNLSQQYEKTGSENGYSEVGKRIDQMHKKMKK